MSNDLHHLAAAYALDALDADERVAFESHYPTCEICAGEVDEFRATAAVLAADVRVDPPAGLKGDVMAAVARTRQISPLPGDRFADRRRARPTGFGMSLAAAAAALLLFVGAMAVFWADSGTDGVTEVVASSDAVVTTLAGDSGAVQVVWSAERGEIAVLGNDLADPGPGLVYELWFLLDDGVAPAGLFEPGSDNEVRTVLTVDDIEGNGWGITIEPEGGSEQPTGDVLFAGEII